MEGYRSVIKQMISSKHVTNNSRPRSHRVLLLFVYVQTVVNYTATNMDLSIIWRINSTKLSNLVLEESHLVSVCKHDVKVRIVDSK